PDHGDHGGSRLYLRLDVAVFGRPHAGTARGAEGGDLGGLEHRVLHALEEAQVLGVGSWPSPLDVVDAEGVEPLGDADLVLHGERDALALGAVAEGSVVDLDLPGHETAIIALPRPECQVSPPADLSPHDSAITSASFQGRLEVGRFRGSRSQASRSRSRVLWSPS